MVLSLAACLVLSWISVYSGINRTIVFLSLSYFMFIKCTQSSVHQMNLVMNRRFVEFLGVPKMKQSSSGDLSLYFIFWMLNSFQNHPPLPKWNVKSNSSPPTDLRVLAPGGAGIPTELIFSLLLRKNFFICSESHWMSSVALWLHNSWSYSLPRIYHRIIRKQKLEDLYRCEHKFPWFILTYSGHLLNQVSPSPAKILHKQMWCAKLGATHLYLHPLAERGMSSMAGGK